MCVLGVSAAFRPLSIGGPSGMVGREVSSAGPQQSFKESKGQNLFSQYRGIFLLPVSLG